MLYQVELRPEFKPLEPPFWHPGTCEVEPENQLVRLLAERQCGGALRLAGLAELADAPGLEPGGATHGGSSPSSRTLPLFDESLRGLSPQNGALLAETFTKQFEMTEDFRAPGPAPSFAIYLRHESGEMKISR